MSKPNPVVERRYTAGAVELRAAADGEAKRTVRGYAALYNSPSENLGTQKYRFIETIAPGAFDDVLKDDVRALFNHDANFILARSKGGEGTLKIGTDARGLWYEFEAPDTQAGRDLLVSLARGDVDQSSFAFEVRKDGQEYRERTEGDVTIAERTIKKVARLHDVSPVTYPAYPDTTVALRAKELAEPEAQSAAAATTPEPFQPTGAQAARLGLRL
jgi:HK97 family phage prohead protease